MNDRMTFSKAFPWTKDRAGFQNLHHLAALPIVFLFLSALLASCSEGATENASDPPNIVYILADDLGYGELGAYGQEVIETPNLDSLAAAGMRFTDHYAGSAVCAPSRCVLMTGLHTGHAHIRGNDEWGERGEVWDYLAMFRDSTLEGQRPIPDSALTVGEMLQAVGYQTAAIGKWGLGAPGTEGLPNKQGFDLWFGYNCQRQAHTFYPLHLWKNDQRVMLRNDTVAPRTKLAPGADPEDPGSYAPFRLTDYAPDLMQEEALGFIRENKDRPFFLYYPTTIPHLPLQAPKKWVDHYREKLGPEEPYLGDRGYFPNQYPKATYAAMISYLDEQVGEIVQELRALGLYENTLIMFSSDNGPTYTGGVDPAVFNSAGPFREDRDKVKGSLREGGIRVPMIASWPGRIAPGTTTNLPSSFYDVMATLADVSGGTAAPITDGLSFLPTLLGKPEDQRMHEYLYWEFPGYGGQQAVRQGKWKALRENMQEGNLDIQLYDLEADPTESTNLAEQYPERVEAFRKIMDEAHEPPTLETFEIKALADR